jgi:hypothetical protein
MADDSSWDARHERALALRLFFVALGAAALFLGYFGLGDYLAHNPQYGIDPLDLLYWDFQLFVLDSAPLGEGGSLPWSLQFARFAAPAATAYALFTTAHAVFMPQIERARARFARGHTIVCGADPAMLFLVRGLRAEDSQRKVVMIDPRPTTATRTEYPAGVLRVAGDAREPEVLVRAGVGGAREVMALTPDSAFNAEVALMMRAVKAGDGKAATCYAEVSDREVCAEIAARALSVDARSPVRLEFFSREDRAARQLLERHPTDSKVGGVPAAVLVVGGSPLAQALLRELARRPRAATTNGTVPSVRSVTDVGGAKVDLTDIEVGTGADARPPTHVFVALTDEQAAIRVGIRIARLLDPQRTTIVAMAGKSTVFGRVLKRDRPPIVGDAQGLVLHNVIETVYAPASVRHGDIEAIARATHEAYVAECEARGETADTNPSTVPWDELPEHLKEDNRAQADDIGRKLAHIGLTTVPATGHEAPFNFYPSEIEALARLEHQRWVDHRRATGWKLGKTKDIRARITPDLKHWDDLTEESQNKDRSAVRAIPDILATAGFAIIRPSTC